MQSQTEITFTIQDLLQAFAEAKAEYFENIKPLLTKREETSENEVNS